MVTLPHNAVIRLTVLFLTFVALAGEIGAADSWEDDGTISRFLPAPRGDTLIQARSFPQLLTPRRANRPLVWGISLIPLVWLTATGIGPLDERDLKSSFQVGEIEMRYLSDNLGHLVMPNIVCRTLMSSYRSLGVGARSARMQAAAVTFGGYLFLEIGDGFHSRRFSFLDLFSNALGVGWAVAHDRYEWLKPFQFKVGYKNLQKTFRELPYSLYDHTSYPNMLFCFTYTFGEWASVGVGYSITSLGPRMKQELYLVAAPQLNGVFRRLPMVGKNIESAYVALDGAFHLGWAFRIWTFDKFDE